MSRREMIILPQMSSSAFMSICNIVHSLCFSFVICFSTFQLWYRLSNRLKVVFFSSTASIHSVHFLEIKRMKILWEKLPFSVTQNIWYLDHVTLQITFVMEKLYKRIYFLYSYIWAILSSGLSSSRLNVNWHHN